MARHANCVCTCAILPLTGKALAIHALVLDVTGRKYNFVSVNSVCKQTNEQMVKMAQPKGSGSSVERIRLLSKLPHNFAILKFVLKLLRILGLAAFNCERNVTKDRLCSPYSFKYGEFHSLLPLMSAILASFGSFVFLTHIGLKKFFIFPPGFVNNSTMTPYVLRFSRFFTSGS